MNTNHQMMESAGAVQMPSVELTKANVGEVTRDLPKKAKIVLRAITMLQYGSLEITVPGGRKFNYSAPGHGPHGVATLHNWGVINKVLSNGSMGVAESYIAGDWDSPDTTSFLELFLKNAYGGGAEGFFQRNTLLTLVSKISHWMNRNSKSGSKRNISAHYDLGNEFYRLWLDPSMTYSSAIFRDGANSLEEAQEAKYRSLAERTDIKPDHHVLEIGCGWGGFAEFIAGKIGARVTCLTISKEQFKYATDRIKRAGLDDKVEIKFQDYRDETGLYDRIGSIEMFEAVGESYWPSYFDQLKNCLKPGGRAGLQVITIQDADLDHYRSSPDFIQKYIFPGGMLPSAEVLQKHGEGVGLEQISTRAFGYDYALTLEEWRKQFWHKWSDIKPLGFDERFKRIWEYYFHYCEAGFKTDTLDVRQVVFEKA